MTVGGSDGSEARRLRVVTGWFGCAGEEVWSGRLVSTIVDGRPGAVLQSRRIAVRPCCSRAVLRTRGCARGTVSRAGYSGDMISVLGDGGASRRAVTGSRAEQMLAAKDPDCAAATLQALLGSTSGDVRVVAAGHANVPEIALLPLVGAGDQFAMRAMLRNLELSEPIVTAIGRYVLEINWGSRVGGMGRRAWLENTLRHPNVGREILERCLLEDDSTLRRMVAGSPALPADMAAQLLAEREPGVAVVILGAGPARLNPAILEHLLSGQTKPISSTLLSLALKRFAGADLQLLLDRVWAWVTNAEKVAGRPGGIHPWVFQQVAARTGDTAQLSALCRHEDATVRAEARGNPAALPEDRVWAALLGGGPGGALTGHDR